MSTHGAAALLIERVGELQRSFPVAGDRVLVDLVNGIEVSRDVLRFRGSRNLLGRLFGGGAARDGLVLENLVSGQAGLLDVVKELTGSLTLTQLSLTLAQQALEDARGAIHGQGRAVTELQAALDDATSHLSTRVNALAAELRSLELRVAADGELDRIVGAWSAGRTYAGLSWPVQVALVAREVFSGAVGAFEVETGDGVRYRELLADQLVRGSGAGGGWFELGNLLDDVGRATGGRTGEVAAGLLETRTAGWRRTAAMPHLFALGTALELATLSREARPPRVGPLALALCDAHVARLPRAWDAHALARALIRETADDCVAILPRHPLPPGVAAVPVRIAASVSARPARAQVAGPAPRMVVPEETQPVVGLVLAGGGARGAYQAGAVKYLAEAGFTPRLVAGTSIGALNGAIVASHGEMERAAAALEAIWTELGTTDLLHAQPASAARLAASVLPGFAGWLAGFLADSGVLPDGEGYFDPEPLERLLRAHLSVPALRAGTELWVAAFPSLQVPGLRYGVGAAVADGLRAWSGAQADWLHLQACDDDALFFEILLASAAIPLAFPRREVGGRRYVDGGLADNVPLGALAARGCTAAVVVHLSNGSAWSRHDYPLTAVVEIRPRRRVMPEIPLLGSLGTLLDFSATRIGELMEQGYEDARACIEPVGELLRLHAVQRSARSAMLEGTIGLAATDSLD